MSHREPWTHRAAAWVGSRVRGAIFGVRYGATVFEGAVTNRLTMDWVLAPIVSADQELRGSLRKLRARAREIARNDAHGSRVLSLQEENVVGPFGVTLQARVDVGDEDRNELINRAIEEAWYDWCRPENCSVDGTLSMTDIQNLAIRGRTQDGEAIIRMVEGVGPYGFALQVIDPDQLDDSFDRQRREDGLNEIRMGVEVDEWGRRVTYHVLKSHPYDYIVKRGQNERIPIPARDIIHFYKVRRPGQTRGVTDFAPVMRDLHHLHGYREAELVAARMGAAKGGFFKRPAELARDPKAAQKKITLPTSAEPGTFDELPQGYEFQEYNPQHPTTAFGDFCKSILKTIASAVRVAYATMTGDLTEVSFSSIRKGDQTEKDSYLTDQWAMVEHVLEPIYPRFLLWALTTGKLVLPSLRVSDWSAHDWQPRGFPYVDPLKDVLADELAIAMGLDSRTDASARRGRAFEDNIRQRKREEAFARKEKVDINTGKNTGSAAAAQLALTPYDPDKGDDEDTRAILQLLLKRAGITSNGGQNGHHPSS